MRDARHDGELLVRIGQQFEERDQVLEAGDAVVFAAHDDRRGRDLLRIDQRQPRAHVDVGAVRHRVVEREDRVGERFDRHVVGGAGVVAREDAVDERSVDRPAVLALELGAASLPARRASGCPCRSTPSRRARVARPARGDARRTARRAARRTRCRTRGADRSSARLQDIFAGGREIVGAVGDVAVDIAALVGAAVAFHVDAPAVEAARREIVHHRGIRAARNLQIERRLRRHRRTVHEQDRARRLRDGRGRCFSHRKSLHVALCASNARARRRLAGCWFKVRSPHCDLGSAPAKCAALPGVDDARTVAADRESRLGHPPARATAGAARRQMNSLRLPR